MAANNIVILYGPAVITSDIASLSYLEAMWCGKKYKASAIKEIEKKSIPIEEIQKMNNRDTYEIKDESILKLIMLC